LGGVAAFAYAGALWYAAPAFFRHTGAIADRLRVAILLGVAIPFVLGFIHLLYAPVLWIAVAALVAWRATRRTPAFDHDPALYATLSASLIVMWPPLVRPLLDGDTLLYHLPNAVAFVQAHSIWTASAPYWVYPPASELFASGIFAASGRWSLPIAGILPALLIAARLFSVARKSGAPAYAAASIPLAFVCAPLTAVQNGTLQNDLWLAAFFVEILSGADRSPFSVGVCALLKPFGWIEALIAAVAARVPWRACAIGFIPLAAWIARDAILLGSGASVGFSTPPYFANTIAGNFGIAITQLAHGVATVTPQSFTWIALLLAGYFFRGSRRYAIAGTAALVLYGFLPLAYKSGATNYVLDASSFRFALPALGAGALIAATLLPLAPRVGAIASYAIAAWGAWTVLAIFWNDAYTHWAILVAAIAIVAAVLTGTTRGVSVALLALVVIVAGRWGAASRAQGFYADWMRDAAGKSTGVFAWIASHRPERVVAENVRTGAILMMSPQTQAVDAPLETGCELARRDRALLLVGSNEDTNGPDLAQAFARARGCGSVLYEDGAAFIVRPHSLSP
jgi:hypothetical protein